MSSAEREYPGSITHLFNLQQRLDKAAFRGNRLRPSSFLLCPLLQRLTSRRLFGPTRWRARLSYDSHRGWKPRKPAQA